MTLNYLIPTMDAVIEVVATLLKGSVEKTFILGRIELDMDTQLTLRRGNSRISVQ